MELGKLPKDVIQYLALEMDVGDLLSLCRTNKELNVKICKNRNIWINKLNKDFPDWINKDENEKKNLSRLYQTIVLDRDFPGWDELPEDKGDLLMLYEKLLKIHKSDYGIEVDYYMSKLEEEYPDTDFNRMYDTYSAMYSGKEFYRRVKDVIKVLKEKYGYEYIDGNPLRQNGAFMYAERIGESYDYESLLKYILINYPALSLGLVKFCIDHGAKVTETMIKDLNKGMEIPYSKDDYNFQELKRLMKETLEKQNKKISSDLRKTIRQIVKN